MKNTVKNILCIILSVMLISSLSVTAFAADTYSGKGTYSQPYLITSAEDFAALGRDVAGGNNFEGKFFEMQNDIVLTADFTPIGSESAPFAGQFNGNGKKISGLDVSEDYAALFAFCDGAVISNLEVGGSFSADKYAGAVAAYAKNTVIKNCTVSASVTVEGSYAGGIVGYISSGSIKSCSTSGTTSVMASSDYCGGIVGYSGADISDCTNNAYIIGHNAMGGIAGYCAGNISLCTNNINLEADGNNAGGIVGISAGKVEYCKNTGNVTADSVTGGIVGAASKAEISQCINTGAVSAYANYAGGTAGWLTESTVVNCVAAASIATDEDYAGGIFGSAQKSEVKKCVFKGNVITSNGKGGAVGALANSSSSITDCYFNSSAKALYTGNAAGTTSLSASEITSKTALGALDFNTVWEINTLHAGYPLLKNVSFHTLSAPTTVKATCTKNGTVSGTCIRCNEPVTVTTPASGHSYMTVSSKLPTCTAKGYVDRVCTECGDAKTEYIAATGHTDKNGDKICDVCSASTEVKDNPQTEKSFFEKIADFFKTFFEWLKSLLG